MEIKSLGYRTDLLLLELSGSVFHDAGEYVVVRTPDNPGFWWGNFLLYRTPFAPGDTKTAPGRPSTRSSRPPSMLPWASTAWTARSAPRTSWSRPASRSSGAW